MTEKTEGKWTLRIGCHQGTLMSREHGDAIPDLESFEACVARAKKIKGNWAEHGLELWYATAYGPNGEQLTALHGEPYKS